MNAKKPYEGEPSVAHDSRSLLMRVSKEEKTLLEIRRLKAEFKQNPYHYQTEAQVLEKVHQVYNPNQGEKLELSTIREIFQKAFIEYMEENPHQAQILVDRSLKFYHIGDPFTELLLTNSGNKMRGYKPGVEKKYGYNVHLSYKLPTALRINKLSEDTKEFRTTEMPVYLKAFINSLLLIAKANFQKITPEVQSYLSGTLWTKSYDLSFPEDKMQVVLSSQLNFQRALVQWILETAKKTTTNIKNYILAISKDGRISALAINSDTPEEHDDIQTQLAELIGTQISSENILNISKNIQPNPFFKNGTQLTKNLENLIQDNIRNSVTGFLIPIPFDSLTYNSILFDSISTKDVRQLANEVSWEDERDVMLPITLQAYQRILDLESMAMDTFLDLNSVEGFEEERAKAQREELQLSGIQKIGEGIVVSYFYSQELLLGWHSKVPTPALPLFAIPDYSKVLKNNSWKAFFYDIANKSFENLDLVNQEKDTFQIFPYQTKDTEYTVIGYTFSLPRESLNSQESSESNEKVQLSICLITRHRKEELVRSKNFDMQLKEKMRLIMNILKESEDMKWVRERLFFLKYHGKLLREEGNLGWETGMVGQFIAQLEGGISPHTRGPIFLETRKQIQEQGLELYCLISEDLQEEDYLV